MQLSRHVELHFIYERFILIIVILSVYMRDLSQLTVCAQIQADREHFGTGFPVVTYRRFWWTKEESLTDTRDL